MTSTTFLATAAARCRLGLLVALLPWLGGCESLFFKTVNAGPPGTVQTRTYAPDRHLQLDVHVPAQPAPGHPVVVFFYGGSWQTGDRAQYAFVGESLAREGIVAMVADYRLSPQVTFPAFETDAASAVRWARDHAGEFGGDAAHLFVAGHSAGAQIAALLGTDARYLAAEGMRPRDLAGIIGIAGPYDFLPITDPKIQAAFGPPSQWPQTQPIGFVDGDEPPFLLLQGLADHVVAPANARSLQRRLLAAHECVQLREYPHVGHSRILAALRYGWLGDTLRDTAAYVRARAAGVPCGR